MVTHSNPKYKTLGRTAKPGFRLKAFRAQPVVDICLQTVRVRLDLRGSTDVPNSMDTNL